MDVLAVTQACRFAREHAISGQGPLVMEFVTYRYGADIKSSKLILGGHSMSDPGTTYRTRKEIQNMRSSNDAIQGLKSKLLEWKVVTEAELKVNSMVKSANV
jgi:pyruvate dehydrogenase E1 component alpha subunit